MLSQVDLTPDIKKVFKWMARSIKSQAEGSGQLHVRLRQVGEGSGQVNVWLGQVSSRLGQVGEGPVRFMFGQVGMDQVKFVSQQGPEFQDISYQVYVWLGWVRLGQVGLGQVRLVRLRLDYVSSRLGQVGKDQVSSASCQVSKLVRTRIPRYLILGLCSVRLGW